MAGSPKLTIEALRGPFRPEDDYPVTEQPKNDPTFGENNALWFFDDANQLHSYNHLTTLDELFSFRRERNWIVLPNGTDNPRVLVSWSEGGRTTPKGPGGANMIHTCVEPFRRWTLDFTGTMRDMTADELSRSRLCEGPRKLVRVHIDAEMAAPPWHQGSLSKEAVSAIAGQSGKFVGGVRYEQLYRMSGSVRIYGDGGREYKISGTGLRTHRRGTRQMSEWHGHSWQTALFPSGRAFGLMRFPDADGSKTMQYDEAFIYDEGVMSPVKVLESAWLTDYRGAGETFRIRLRSDKLGEQTIHGEVMGVSWRTIVPVPQEPLDHRHGVWGEPGTFVMAQGAARYSWNGETVIGQIERSTPLSLMPQRASLML